MEENDVAVARLDERVKALYTLLDERAKQVDIAFKAAEKATDTALQAQQRVNLTQNEFRGALSDSARLLMPRAEAEQAFRGINEKIESLTARVNARDERGSGMHQGWLITVGAIGVIGTVAGVASMLL